VLTPQEADEVLGHVRDFARAGLCTVLIITHKFREVMAYADDVTVLRRGKAVHHCARAGTDPARLAQAMVGDALGAASRRFFAHQICRRHIAAGQPKTRPSLKVQGLKAMGDRGTLAVHELSLSVRAGEILGVAGVSATASASWWRRWSASARAPRQRAGDGPALQRHAQGEPPPEGAQPARGAAAQCLRRRPERGREHGAARFRPAAAVAGGRCVSAAGAAARANGLPLRHQDAGRGRADPQPVGRQRAARRAGARAGGRHQCADRRQPGVRPGLSPPSRRSTRACAACARRAARCC
jgi:hypothetical protein